MVSPSILPAATPAARRCARFIPRLFTANPALLLDEQGQVDPAEMLNMMMKRKKAGGHSERSIAMGTIEGAIWDALAKIADKPLRAMLGERFSGAVLPSRVVLLCRRRLVLAGTDRQGPAG